MRYSANLNIIIKAIEKATSRMSRDFIELEHLQTNAFSANKFTTACYNRAKEVLAEDLSRVRPEYNLAFLDGQKIIHKQDAEYSYLVYPIDGISNLSRSNPDFTVAIALQHLAADGSKETISLAISKVVGGEMYYCEKGFGAYINNRRIRVSKRAASDNPVISCENHSFLTKDISIRTYGCRTMEIAYLASSRTEAAVFKNDNREFLNPLFLLVKEAGGKIIENDKFVTATNGLIEV